MPAPSIPFTVRELAKARDEIQHYETLYHRTSRIEYDDLIGMVYIMPKLRINHCIDRTYASLKKEYEYRSRAYFVRGQRLRISQRSYDGASLTFRGGYHPDLSGTDPQGLRFTLTSLDGSYVLALDVPTRSRAIAGYGSIDVSVTPANEILRLGSPVPVLVHRKGNIQNLPEFMLTRFDSDPSMVIRELPKAADFVMATYGFGRFEGIWSALERIWCETLLCQRPLIRPLLQVSVEARIRSLVGSVIRIEHTEGTVIGRCPQLDAVLDAESIPVDTVTTTINVRTDSILEIAPWQSNYGRQVVIKS